MSKDAIKIGTRGSRLAMAQSQYVARRLTEIYPEIKCHPVEIKTTGDADRRSALHEIGGTGLFTKTIEQELLDGNIDLAVHSAKDLPAVMTPGLAIGAVPPRESPADVWISKTARSLSATPAGSLVGTGSVRRKAQLLYAFPNLRVADIRGNVETRLKKLEEGRYEALIMAHAGIIRSGFEDRITETLPLDDFIPSPGQGCLVVQVRTDDKSSRDLVAPLNDPEARLCLETERLFLSRLGAGCSASVGGLARIIGGRLNLMASVLDKTGKRRLLASGNIDIDKYYRRLVDDIAGRLLSDGAEKLLDESDG